MSDRPTIDDLKRKRDGTLSAGRAPPDCSLCGEPITPEEQPDCVIRGYMHVDAEDGSWTEAIVAHRKCSREADADG